MTQNETAVAGPIASELVKVDPSFADIVEEFVQGLADRVAKMEGAVASQDFAELRMLAHQLKGSAGGYGYQILTDRAGHMEQNALSQELEAVQADLDSLKDLVSRVVIHADD